MLLWAASHQLDAIRFISLFAEPWTAACQASLSITNPGAYPSSCPSTWWCYSTISSCLPLLFLPSIFPNIRVISNESVLPIRWANNWSFSISTSSEYSELISFRVDWFGLLAVQGMLKSLLQHHSSKGICVCYLSVTSYSPCWDLTTKTEFKQHEKMRIKSQCLIYIHLATGDAPVLFKGQAWIDLMQEEALKVLDESLNMIVFTWLPQ